ncbi:MAG: hypothetical protein ABSG76_01210 [Xanthobacteraceae bacterium]
MMLLPGIVNAIGGDPAFGPALKDIGKVMVFDARPPFSLLRTLDTGPITNHYVLALAPKPDGGGALQPLAAFTTNPAGSAIVDAVSEIRQLVEATEETQRRYLVIVAGTADHPGALVQVQEQ